MNYNILTSLQTTPEKIMDINEKINRLKQQIKIRAIADDGYYLSPQYEKDEQALYELQQKLKEEVACKNT